MNDDACVWLHTLCVHYKQFYGVMLLLFSCMLTIVHDRHVIVCMHGSQTYAS